MFSKKFSWFSLGGLGEVGMNCMVFQFGDLVIPVDAGILFADPNDFGIEALHPDYRNLFKKHPIQNWIFTHGHEDHIGACSSVLRNARELQLPPPTFWAPPFAAALIREKLRESHPKEDVTSLVRSIDWDRPLEIESLKIHFIPMRHSIPDAASLYFEWIQPESQLKVFHTADFKLDEKKYPDGIICLETLKSRIPDPIDFLFIDSTNSEREGHSISELEIIEPLFRLTKEISGRIYVTLFSSNVFRIASLIHVAARLGRKACLAGRSMESTFRLANELHLHKEQCLDFPTDILLPPEQITRLPPDKQFILCSGSQGEYRSVLYKMALGEHPYFQIQPGDAIIFSSKLIPGNERPVSRLINGLTRLGADVFWGDRAQQRAQGPIHASGHARQEEIQALARLLRPRHIIPVHGELRQLKANAELLKKTCKSEIHVCENHTLLEFQFRDESWRLENRAIQESPTKILRFENFFAESRDPFLIARKKIAKNGLVVASTNSYGQIQVSLEGVFPEESLDDEKKLFLKSEVENFIHSKLKIWKAQGLFQSVEESQTREISQELSRALKKSWGFKPYTIVHLIPDLI